VEHPQCWIGQEPMIRLGSWRSACRVGMILRRGCAVFACSEAQEQHGSVKAAVRNTPTGLPVEAIEQFLTNLAGPGGGVGTARQQRQQVVWTRRLYVPV